MDSKTINAVIDKLEERMERQNTLAHHYLNQGDDAQWNLHIFRALELEFAINDIKEMAA